MVPQGTGDLLFYLALLDPVQAGAEAFHLDLALAF